MCNNCAIYSVPEIEPGGLCLRGLCWGGGVGGVLCLGDFVL